MPVLAADIAGSRPSSSSGSLPPGAAVLGGVVHLGFYPVPPACPERRLVPVEIRLVQSRILAFVEAVEVRPWTRADHLLRLARRLSVSIQHQARVMRSRLAALSEHDADGIAALLDVTTVHLEDMIDESGEHTPRSLFLGGERRAALGFRN